MPQYTMIGANIQDLWLRCLVFCNYVLDISPHSRCIMDMLNGLLLGVFNLSSLYVETSLHTDLHWSDVIFVSI